MQADSDGAKALLDEVLSRLEGELLEVRALRDQVEAEYRERLEPLASRVRALEAAVGHQREVLQNYEGGQLSSPSKDETEKLTDLAFQVLSEAGEPLHYRGLAEVLTSKGAGLTGKDPGTMLINYLRREPERFCRTATPGYYALVEWQLPDAKPVSGERKATGAKKRTTRSKAVTKKATPKRKTRRTTK